MSGRTQLACLPRAFVWPLQAVQTRGYVLLPNQAALSVLVKCESSCLPGQALTNLTSLSAEVTSP